MKRLILLAVFAVSWDVSFNPFRYSMALPYTSHRKAVFASQIERQAFLDHVPSGSFECTDRWSGESGFCTVKNVSAD
jgi:hypothetical protein